VQEKKSENQQTFDTTSQEKGTLDNADNSKRSKAENPEPNPKILNENKKKKIDRKKKDEKDPNKAKDEVVKPDQDVIK